MKVLLFALCTALVTTFAMATTPSEEDAEKMLIVLQTEKHLQERLAALDKLNRRSFAERIGSGKPLTAEQRAAVETAVVTASQIVRSELSWEIIKTDLIRIIREIFDGDELKSILSLYATSTESVLPGKLRDFEEILHRYMLDRINALGPWLDAEIDRELRELRTSQLETTSDPLAHLKGDWVITTFLFGGGYSGISGCGLDHQPTSIVSHSDGMIEVSTECRDRSEYYLKLVRGNDHRSYLFTVNNKEGINVVDIPLKYFGSKGWMGSVQHVVEGKEISLTAAITPIEGKTWYGWATGVRPTEEARVDYGKAKTPYLKVDFIRRK